MDKCSGLVSVLIVVECTRAIAILVDLQCRARAGVNSDNPFVSTYMKHSFDGTKGYNEIMSVCRLINITVITATGVKHSAFFAMDNIDDTAIDRFMEHMGHSKSIDRNVYTVPQAIQNLETIGPIINFNTVTCAQFTLLYYYFYYFSHFINLVIYASLVRCHFENNIL